MNQLQKEEQKKKRKRKERATQKTGGDSDHKQRHWLRYCMQNTISAYQLAIDGAINSDAMATGI